MHSDNFFVKLHVVPSILFFCVSPQEWSYLLNTVRLQPHRWTITHNVSFIAKCLPFSKEKRYIL